MAFGTGFSWWYVAIGIVISIIGAALWDWPLKPFFSKIGKVFYAIVSLGRQSAIDGIYREAARENSQFVSTEIFYMATSFMFVIAMFLGMAIIWTPNADQFEFISNFKESLNECNNLPEQEVAACLDGVQDIALMTVRLITIPLIVVFFVMLFYKTSFVVAVNGAIITFRQNLRICAPYMNVSDIRFIRKDFALMQSEADYKKLMSQLEEIAADNDLAFPKK